MFFLKRQLRNPHFFQKCSHFHWNLNKVRENDNTFERNEDCATVFLKWKDFNRIFWKWCLQLNNYNFLLAQELAKEFLKKDSNHNTDTKPKKLWSHCGLVCTAGRREGNLFSCLCPKTAIFDRFWKHNNHNMWHNISMHAMFKF